MKSLFNRWKWFQIVEGVILLALGLILAICCWMSGFDQALGYIVATVILLDAILFIALPLIPKKLEFDMSIVVGGALAAIAVFLFMEPTFLKQFLPVLVGTVLVAVSVYFLTKAVKDILDHLRPVTIAFDFAAWALSLALGITFLVFGIQGTASDITNILLTIVGAALALVGLMIIISTIVIVARARKARS